MCQFGSCQMNRSHKCVPFGFDGIDEITDSVSIHCFRTQNDSMESSKLFREEIQQPRHNHSDTWFDVAMTASNTSIRLAHSNALFRSVWHLRTLTHVCVCVCGRERELGAMNAFNMRCDNFVKRRQNKKNTFARLILDENCYKFMLISGRYCG